MSELTVYNWVIILGIPSLFSACVAFVVAQFKQIGALKKGVQAILRDRLYSMYKKAVSKGYTELWERQNFDNLYVQYHSMGKNGVMDNIKMRFFELPDEATYKRGK